MLKPYRNVNFKKRDPECTNIVGCMAEDAPNANYKPCDASEIKGLQQLWIEDGVRYFGYL